MDGESNPYAPPASRLEAPDAPPAAEELASSGQRLSNLLLDTLGTYVFAFLVGLGVALVDESRLGLFDDFRFGLALSIAYYGGSEALTGRTPAKLLTGTTGRVRARRPRKLADDSWANPLAPGSVRRVLVSRRGESRRLARSMVEHPGRSHPQPASGGAVRLTGGCRCGEIR